MINSIDIDSGLAKKLIDSQFPNWRNLVITPIIPGGWDNRMFRLGNDLVIRIPSHERYAAQIKKEQYWLPILADELPIPIPLPVAMGEPEFGLGYQWSIYKWIEGTALSSHNILDQNSENAISKALAMFLKQLHRISVRGGPKPGPHNFHRGGELAFYDLQMRQALDILGERIDVSAAKSIWLSALDTTWKGPNVWVHGDISPGNLLVGKNNLSTVLDFGCMCIGDPACDLSIAWTFFKAPARQNFKETLGLDEAIWLRAKGWALWKAAIIISGIVESSDDEKEKQLTIFRTVLEE